MPDRAECFFQPINIGDGATARASLEQIRRAASALFLKCAASDPSQGGIVKNIGKNRPIWLYKAKRGFTAYSHIVLHTDLLRR